jgi:GNAT superfamily N-acetyltransferase
MVIRKATIEDVPGIARVHIDSWRTTYKGIVPQRLIDSFTYKAREELWRRALSPDSASFVYVAENADGRIVGFASGGPAGQDAPNHDGELYAIYLLQEHQGKGIGRQLFEGVVRTLVERGMRSMAIWVLADYPACGFYERMGGRKVYERQEEIGGGILEEIGYGWDNISGLVRHEDAQ